MSHSNLLQLGFNYLFGSGPDYLTEQKAQRATFDQFQTFPQNMVQGSGRLVAQSGVPGKYWSVFQPPQVDFQNNAIDAAILGSGEMHGIIALQPLIDTTTFTTD